MSAANHRPAPRLHYAWIAAGVTFLTLLAAAGASATPGVILLPVGNEFQWSRATVSSIVSINIFLYGLIGPFAAAIYQRFGFRRTMMTAMALLAIAAGADVILLDNMSVEQMRQVVADAPDGILFEASGGVNYDTIREVAATGVHLVSAGALTHSAPALDISLEIEAQ